MNYALLFTPNDCIKYQIKNVLNCIALDLFASKPLILKSKDRSSLYIKTLKFSSF